MLKDLRLRLFKVMPFDDTDADTLAQEIATALADESQPADFPGITLPPSTQGGKAPIQVTGGDTTGNIPIIQVGRGTNTVTISLNINNELVVNNQTVVGSGGTPPSQSGGAFAGTVVSGSGTSYEVRLTSGQTVNATQLFNDGQDIPAGAGAVLAKDGNTYYMQAQISETMPGTVASGSGTTYRVNLFNGVSVTASQMQISGSTPVPSGTKVMVTRYLADYYIQAPVWL